MEQGFSKIAVFHHVAKGLVANIFVVVVQEKQRFSLGYPDIKNRRSVGLQRRPQTQPCQNAARRQGNGRGATVEAGIEIGHRVSQIDNANLQTGLPQRRRQGSPDQATTDNQNFGLDHVHAQCGGLLFSSYPCRFGSNAHKDKFPRFRCHVQKCFCSD